MGTILFSFILNWSTFYYLKFFLLFLYIIVEKWRTKPSVVVEDLLGF